MKKLLAIILAGLMVFSAVGVFAEETSESETKPNGYLSGYSSEDVYSYSQDFNEFGPIADGYNAYKTYWKLRDDSTKKGYMYYKSEDATSTSEYRLPIGNYSDSYDSSFNKSEDDKFFTMYMNNTMKVTNVTDNKVYYNANPRLHMNSGSGVKNARVVDESGNVTAADKLHISFDIKNDDLIFEKRVNYQEGQNYIDDHCYKLFSMGTDGYMQFYNDGNFQFKYDLNTWYSIDIVLDFYNMNTQYSVNNQVVYEGEIATYQEDYLNMLAFVIMGSAGTLSDDQVVSYSIDNFSIELKPGSLKEEAEANGFVNGDSAKSYIQTFDGFTNFTRAYGTFANVCQDGDWALRHGSSSAKYYTDSAATKTSSYDTPNENGVLSYDSSSGKDADDKYFYMSVDSSEYGEKITTQGSETLTRLYHSNPRLYGELPITGASGDIVNINFDIKNDDFIFPKVVKYQKSQSNDDSIYTLLTMGTDGNMTFYNSSIKVPYNAGEWYNIDMRLDFLNGKVYYKVNDFDVAAGVGLTYDENGLKTLIFTIPSSQTNIAAMAEDEVSRINIDNLAINLLPATLDITTSGSMNGETVNGISSTMQYTDDYSVLPTRPTDNYSSSLKGVDITVRYGATSNVIDYSSANATPVNAKSGSYLLLRQATEVTNEYGPAYQYLFNFTGFAQDEKVHIAFDAMNSDSNYDKHVFLSRSTQPMQNPSGRTRTLVNMKSDGTMTFGNFDDVLTDDYAIAYNIGRWYHFDVVFDYTSVTSNDSGVINSGIGNVYYYVDGVLVATIENVDLYALEVNSNNYDFMNRLGFGIDNKDEYNVLQAEYAEIKAAAEANGETPPATILDTDLRFESDAEFAIDNLYVQIISAENEPNVTIATPAYSLTNFAVTDFTVGQAGTITASATLENTDPTKKVTFAIATYNADNELTGIKIGATYVLSGNMSLSADVAATDACVKVFVLDDATSITPIQAATVIGTPAA